MNYTKTVVIADAHSAPFQDLRRFDWIGNYIAQNHIDKVVLLGDWVTMDSCSYFPVPRRERTTALEDILAGKEALSRMLEPIRREQDRLRRNRKRIWLPLLAWLDGNHEDRFNRRKQDDEEVLGSLVDLWDLLGIRDQFDLMCGYREYLEIDGILYTHCPQNGLGRPMTGVNRTRQIALQSSKPVVFGHTHKREYRNVARLGNANDINWAINCPAFMEQNHVEEYAQGGATGWTYGAVELTQYEDGTTVDRVIAMAEIESLYKENYNG